MTDRKTYVAEMLQAFKGGMLPAIAQGDDSAYECLEKAHIEIPQHRLPVVLMLGKLFTAVWLWSEKSGVVLPKSHEFDKDFSEFAKQLMNEWPIKECENAGLSIRPIKTSGALVGYQYELAGT